MPGFEPVESKSITCKDNIKYNYFINKFFFNIIPPVQFPLHEPYFDLTPIKVMHTKKICTYIYILLYVLIYTKTKLIAHTPFSA